jgi:protease I
VSLKEGRVQGMNHDEKGNAVAVDIVVTEANVDDFDGLLLPGGVKNPDTLRGNAEAVAFLKSFFDARKSVAAICHGPWMLVEADVVRGRTVTSHPSIRTDLKNAGAIVVDREVVVDDRLVTPQARRPSRLQREDGGGARRAKTRSQQRGMTISQRASATACNVAPPLASQPSTANRGHRSRHGA